MILSSFWRRVLGMSDKPKIVDALGAYQASNILGTVSQSGGIPTGAIIESGSNANGEYVKYADGTMLCYATSVSVQPTNTASGVLYIGSPATAVTFPATFFAVGSVSYSPSAANRWGGGPASLSTTGFTATIYSSVSSATAMTISYIAIGRWF